ncbi:hypothetical protein MKW98_008561 [Papaver atlanticum]|uniref:NAC domain-containing protein n=1 Tax=Papaver atlanticum TaxID=357466 RepID=A0AAD4TDD9_9MAGN|nr:hypothetical protein MKW98_008561 [Papaver atlanticum]
MEKADLKGKRKIEDVYEIQVAPNNQHEDAMITMERANNYDYDNQEVLTEEEIQFFCECIDLELLADQDQCNDYNNQQLPADQDLHYLGDCHNNDVPVAQNVRELPPGFVFNPSDQELLSMYLKPKIGNPEIQFAVMPCIPDVNVYEYHPEKLLENYQEKSGYFFTQRTKRHENGKRPNRTVQGHGYWRMSTTTEPVMEGSKEVGKKSGLVFHTVGRPGDKKSDTKTDWLMKEYHIAGSEWTLCKIYLNK